MRKKIVLDASAWIEYLVGSDKGMQVAKHIREKQPVMNSINLMEVCVYALRKGLNDEKIFRDTLQQVYVIGLTGQESIHAARLYFKAVEKQSKLSYADAIALTTADELKTTLITCDNDFSGIKQAVVIR